MKSHMKRGCGIGMNMILTSSIISVHPDHRCISVNSQLQRYHLSCSSVVFYAAVMCRHAMLLTSEEMLLDTNNGWVEDKQSMALFA